MATQQLPSQTKAKEIFSKAKPEYQALIREILSEERELINMKRRTDIYTRLSDHIRRIIK